MTTSYNAQSGAMKVISALSDDGALLDERDGYKREREIAEALEVLLRAGSDSRDAAVEIVRFLAEHLDVDLGE
jgi:hypothetical protein